jgi:SH3-like domain-containing protein
MRSPAAVLAVIVLLACPAVAETAERAAEITGDSVRMRAGPSTFHTILGELNRGDLVVVIAEEGSWRKVRVPGGFPCWVHASLAEVGTDGTALVTASDVLIRPTAGKEKLPLESKLNRGDVLTVLDREGDWLKVLPPDFVHVYVYGDYVRELGPVEEYRGRVERFARERRKSLTGDRSAELERAAAEKHRKEDRESVLRFGESILAGEGDAKVMEKELTRIVLESDDDLTRGYANSLLALLGYRTEAERLKSEVARAEEEKAEALDGLRADLDEARARYDEALERVRALRSLRENPFRGVGRIEKRGEELVLVEKDRVLFRVESRRFRLEDYVGRKVGVNGRMVVTDEKSGVRHLMVEKLEILEPEPGGR